VYYAEHIAIGSRPFDQAPEILDGLAANGAILSVCTNKKQDLSDKLLDALGLDTRALPPSSAPTVCRPKSRTVTISCGPSRQPGGDPDRAIMVGDSRTDERAARNAGLPFVFVPFGYEAESVEAIGADAVVSHYSQLPAALSRLII
jgi:phosphoglycolate phosphatase